MKTLKKKPKSEQANQIVDSIMEAAARILNEEDNDSFTTNNIADSVGVSIGSLYHYFKNKDNIVEELLYKRMVNTTDLLLENTPANEVIEVGPFVKTIIRAQFDSWNKRNLLSRKILKIAPKILDITFLSELDKKMISYLKNIIEKYEVKNIRKDNLEYSLLLSIQSVRMGIYHCIIYPESYNEKVMEEELVTLVENYLSK